VAASRRPRTEARPRRTDNEKGIDYARPVTEARVGGDLSAVARRAKAEAVTRLLVAGKWRITPSAPIRPTGCGALQHNYRWCRACSTIAVAAPAAADRRVAFEARELLRFVADNGDRGRMRVLRMVAAPTVLLNAGACRVNRHGFTRRAILKSARSATALAVSGMVYGAASRSQASKTMIQPHERGLMSDIASIYLSKFEIPGLSVAIAKDGEIVYAEGFGVVDPLSGARITPSYLFRIADISKPITSVGIFTLWDEPGADGLGARLAGKPCRSCPVHDQPRGHGAQSGYPEARDGASDDHALGRQSALRKGVEYCRAQPRPPGNSAGNFGRHGADAERSLFCGACQLP
jgi:Beta-lactamase